ncbi:hypothetical protein N7488_011451 [Penicillium malachiteum]|nr:hypothetical protein N7488_011451 [Penicillium malachiteum]
MPLIFSIHIIFYPSLLKTRGSILSLTITLILPKTNLDFHADFIEESSPNPHSLDPPDRSFSHSNYEPTSHLNPEAGINLALDFTQSYSYTELFIKMDPSKPKIPPNSKSAENPHGSQSPRAAKRIPLKKSDSSLGRSATAASKPAIKHESESGGTGLDIKRDAIYTKFANFKYGLKRKREASEFVIQMMSTTKDQLDAIDQELSEAKKHRLQIDREHQKLRGKIEEAKAKVDELQKSNVSFPFRMKEAQMSVEAVRKRREDLLDSVDLTMFSRIFGAPDLEES